MSKHQMSTARACIVCPAQLCPVWLLDDYSTTSAPKSMRLETAHPTHSCDPSSARPGTQKTGGTVIQTRCDYSKQIYHEEAAFTLTIGKRWPIGLFCGGCWLLPPRPPRLLPRWWPPPRGPLPPRPPRKLPLPVALSGKRGPACRGGSRSNRTLAIAYDARARGCHASNSDRNVGDRLRCVYERLPCF